MKKIASPQELRSELRRLVAYCGEGTPSRNKLATELQSLANAVEASTTKQGAHNKAKVGDMIQSLHFHRPLDGSVIGTVTRVEVDDKDGVVSCWHGTCSNLLERGDLGA